MKITRILNLAGLLSLGLIFSSCEGKISQGTFILENQLEEEVLIEGYYIPPNFPNQQIEKGEYNIAPNEEVRLFDSAFSDQDGPLSSSNALRIFLSIQGIDSLVMIFENDKHISFTQKNLADSKNPLIPPFQDITGWSTTELERRTFEYRFIINEGHKQAAN